LIEANAGRIESMAENQKVNLRFPRGKKGKEAIGNDKMVPGGKTSPTKAVATESGGGKEKGAGKSRGDMEIP